MSWSWFNTFATIIINKKTNDLYRISVMLYMFPLIPQKRKEDDMRYKDRVMRWECITWDDVLIKYSQCVNGGVCSSLQFHSICNVHRYIDATAIPTCDWGREWWFYDVLQQINIVAFAGRLCNRITLWVIQKTTSRLTGFLWQLLKTRLLSSLNAWLFYAHANGYWLEIMY